MSTRNLLFVVLVFFSLLVPTIAQEGKVGNSVLKGAELLKDYPAVEHIIKLYTGQVENVRETNEKYMTSDIKHQFPEGAATGMDELMANVTNWLAWVPDFSVTIEKVIPADDIVVVRATDYGTLLPKTFNKKFKFPSILIFYLKDSKVYLIDEVYDECFMGHVNCQWLEGLPEYGKTE